MACEAIDSDEGTDVAETGTIEADITETSNTETCSVEENTGEMDAVDPLSPFVQKIGNFWLLLGEPDHVGFLFREIRSNDEKKVTASIFQSDIRKGNEKALKMILRGVCDKNNMTMRHLSLLKGMPSDPADSSLDYLLIIC